MILDRLPDLPRANVVREESDRSVAIGKKVDRIADPHRQRIEAVGPRKLFDRMIAHVHHGDRVRAAAAIMPPHAGLVPFGNERSSDLLISDAMAIGRVRGAERARHRQRFRESAIHVDGPKTEV